MAGCKKTAFDEKRDFKKDLFAKIQLAAPNRKLFEIGEAAKARGHVVLRSPVPHCELNPIELVWSDVKRYLQNYNKIFKLADLEQLVPRLSVPSILKCGRTTANM